MLLPQFSTPFLQKQRHRQSTLQRRWFLNKPDRRVTILSVHDDSLNLSGHVNIELYTYIAQSNTRISLTQYSLTLFIYISLSLPLSLLISQIPLSLYIHPFSFTGFSFSCAHIQTQLRKSTQLSAGRYTQKIHPLAQTNILAYVNMSRNIRTAHNYATCTQANTYLYTQVHFKLTYPHLYRQIDKQL